MKKAFKIIVPFLLVIAIFAGIYWYLFVYDRQFTRDVLLSSARYFERQGNQVVAAWFYDRAYEQGSGSDDVAIELAKQYVNSGSFTKAEKTLFRAIRDGGGVDVYVALSKIFVQQDKLIDALDLLDNVQDADIKEQLDSMRPACPVPQQEPGLYNRYINVEILAPGCTLYVNQSGEYPSMRNDLYTAPIALKDGENAMYALAVSENGLVSPLGIFNYTVGGIVQEMSFADPAMEAAIRDVIQASDDKTVYTNDLWNIKEFTVPEGVSDLSDLKHMIFLESLTIQNCARGQLEVLSGLTTLKSLEIANTPVSSGELKIIGELQNLEKLTLDNCNLSTSAGLTDNRKLTYLNLNNNTIRNIQALADMPELREVHLRSNALTDISALSSSYTLTTLDVSYNSLTSISPISGLSSLSWLDASTNNITNLGDLSQLQSLSYLNISDNALSDLSGLSNCVELKKLHVAKNQLVNIDSLSGLTKLTHLDFSHNQVSALPKWPMNCALISIDGSYNAISSLSALSGLQALNNVLMDYNSEIKNVDTLAECPKLIQVNVYGTKVTDVSALTKQDIIVNYNPTTD